MGPTQYRCTATADTGRRVLLRDVPQNGTDPNALHALDPQRRFVVVPLVTRRTTLQLSQAWTVTNCCYAARSLCASSRHVSRADGPTSQIARNPMLLAHVARESLNDFTTASSECPGNLVASRASTSSARCTELRAVALC